MSSEQSYDSLELEDFPENFKDFIRMIFLRPQDKSDLVLKCVEYIKGNIYKKYFPSCVYNTYSCALNCGDPLLVRSIFLMLLSVEQCIQDMVKEYYEKLSPNSSPIADLPSKDFVDLFIQILVQETEKLRQYPYDAGNISEYLETYVTFFGDVWVKRDEISLRDKFSAV